MSESTYDNPLGRRSGGRITGETFDDIPVGQSSQQGPLGQRTEGRVRAAVIGVGFEDIIQVLITEDALFIFETEDAFFAMRTE